MVGSIYIDEMDNDICGDFFNNIDDLLNFPIEDVEDGGVFGGDCQEFPTILPSPPDDFVGSNSVISGNSSNTTSEIQTEFSVPHEEIAQLEWLSNFVEDSFSGQSITLDMDDSFDNKVSHKFQTSSPVSVLESSSSCPGGKTKPFITETVIRGRARSKRPRPAAFNPRPIIPLISPSSSVTEISKSFSGSDLYSECENFVESQPTQKIAKPVVTEQKKKKKLSSPLSTMEMEKYPSVQPIAIRKCLHCEITKTPQWRAGPMGPKTLCNACGVRHKSGRLFPEYRPAASPTYVASLHSNSHRKVLEMRNKAGENTLILASIHSEEQPFAFT
ncbi:hypothetical protein HHK36_016619 [Tetracentron sinense]|uniref:GATA transcription factor n=1 Tax=Tetracentron sinense TaxID=13715 RepID=A0A835DEE2_TETSI|nr:hypothetical protein HHK36_016619 [Tetracentron sinense]